ncbi:MAG: hypothetical protein HOO06_06965 [Bdellovibrionaceae bacterium]|nr:hypothetical protein [Pseudobdellovibrionaceae bacterium]
MIFFEIYRLSSTKITKNQKTTEIQQIMALDEKCKNLALESGLLNEKELGELVRYNVDYMTTSKALCKLYNWELKATK